MKTGAPDVRCIHYTDEAKRSQTNRFDVTVSLTVYYSHQLLTNTHTDACTAVLPQPFVSVLTDELQNIFVPPVFCEHRDTWFTILKTCPAVDAEFPYFASEWPCIAQYDEGQWRSVSQSSEGLPPPPHITPSAAFSLLTPASFRLHYHSFRQLCDESKSSRVE